MHQSDTIPRRSIVVGGGAAGFFTAIACARADAEREVMLFEKGSHFLTKVRISGGGRCNVTHACFDPRGLSTRYPRGERALISPFHRFQAEDTVEWFQSRGVQLKTEEDGRMFPVTDSSETIIECLMNEANSAGVKFFSKRGVESVKQRDGGGFEVSLTDGEMLLCDSICLATGGHRAGETNSIPESLGHAIEAPVPSLFTFHIETPWLRHLPGLSVEHVEASVPGSGLRERGPVLITHWGLSGPAILRLSAWGARILYKWNYQFPLHINWLPDKKQEQIATMLQGMRDANPGKLVINTPITPLPSRLWEQLALSVGISAETRWARLTRSEAQGLAATLRQTEFPVRGKSLNKEEFVTCGGVPLKEVDFKTMQSRVCPGLYFAGELLDIDGITGGFNFQAAWTTGWISGHAMAGKQTPDALAKSS
ncbi:MAG: NAD(P)/FAD-dependent oxidoreductase [Chthoniobacterales bacterium]